MRHTLTNYILKNHTDNTFFLTADLGYGVLEPLQKALGDQFINVGIAEQSMIGIASGLALSGKEVYTYTISSFYLRALEQIRNDVCYQDARVTMIGAGIDFDYEQLGYTHFALEDVEIMKALPNLDVFTVENKHELEELLSYQPVKPRYVRISRFGENRSFPFDKHTMPKCGGSLDYFKKTYGNKKQEVDS